MRNEVTAVCATLVCGFLQAALETNPDPVAEGYPDWQGLTEKGHVAGRELCASDLRHKVTVIIEVEPNEKLVDQLRDSVWLAMQASAEANGFGTDWMTYEVPREVIVLVSSCGTGDAKEHVMIQETLEAKGKDETTVRYLAMYRGKSCPIYDNVTFKGAPDGTGKRPFAYVMGPEGKEPLFQGQVTKDSLKDAMTAIQKGKEQIANWKSKWRPFYGNIPEPKFHPQLAKALEKGKAGKVSPLDPVAKAILKDVMSSDTEKAREAQVLFDAINQTRTDLEWRIRLEVSENPHRAYYDFQEVLKYWPKEKDRLGTFYARFKGNPDVEAMAKSFRKLMIWSDPNFTPRNAAEVKKIVQDLNKMKKVLKGSKESQNIQIQNAASLVDAKVDDVLSAMSARLPVK